MTLKELQPQLLNLSPSIFLHHWRDIWEELKRMGKSAIAFTTCETYHAMRVRIYGFRSMAISGYGKIYHYYILPQKGVYNDCKFIR